MLLLFVHSTAAFEVTASFPTACTSCYEQFVSQQLTAVHRAAAQQQLTTGITCWHSSTVVFTVCSLVMLQLFHHHTLCVIAALPYSACVF
jgi:hypothetical protein